MITEDYVSFEVAKLLKDKGFTGDEIHKYYDVSDEKPILYSESYIHEFDKDFWMKDLIMAPTLQMVMKWLRKVHNINIDIVSIWNQKRFEYQVFVVTPENAKHCYIDDKLYLGYEQACKEAIKYCLGNLI